ncbi:MepB family protein [Saccharicrinis fermentans]|uniref:MepB protein n=1 Tax=Saccharicrinis fermentans DSM 9555 = JCM 21142 TaxID=869213 RepID=W7XX03_9BACT|nr:MepB family protein [Saccharicrinis fermentans]GAF02950.1 MepB protein [Saccharicrinis fermentans DSM 9555 = JCM 21142]
MEIGKSEFKEKMDRNLNQIKMEIYDKCSLNISDFKAEPESKEYNACQFQLNGLNIRSRNAKITPKKIGQFVTFWERNGNGLIEPFNENDRIDFYTVNVRNENEFGQFVFPKSVLIKQGIISTEKKEGKRGFRVYPKWDNVKNKQAERTQKWQLKYFYVISSSTDLQKVDDLYNRK